MFGRKKQAKIDFTIEKLPSNRWESFFDVLKNRWGLILRSGFTLFLFFLPILASHIITRIYINQIIDDNTLTSLEQTVIIFQAYNINNLVIIFLSFLFAIGLAGILSIYRKLIWQTGISYWEDFKYGVKSNYKSTTILAVFFAIIHFVFVYLLRLNQLEESPANIEIAIAISLVILVYLIPISFFIFAQTTLYKLSFFAKFNNAFLLTMKTAIKTFLFTIGLIVPWMVLLVPILVVQLISIVILILFILPLEVLAAMEYTYGLLDVTINQINYPEIFKKGIWNHAEHQTEEHQ